MPRADFTFCLPMRARYAECDVQGIVFNSRYLEYVDIAVTEYYRLFDMIGAGSGMEFHVARQLIDYKKPVLLDEEFDILMRTSRFGNSSMTVVWEIHGRDAEDLRAIGESVSVHVAEVRGAPTRIPDALVAEFEAYEGRKLRDERKAA